MRVLVTGATGMLGAEIVERFHAAGMEVYGAARLPASDEHANRVAMDITQPDAVREVFDALRPEVVIHCAAMTHVDACERQPQQAYRVNTFGAEVVASNCQRFDAACVYISTDYVFDGQKRAPYHEYDVENPISVYGRSKYLGEQAVRALCPRHYIVRVAWLYGKHRKSFPQFVLEQARAGVSPTVIHDQVGSPTYTVDVADRLLSLIRTDCYGIYHLTNQSPVSRYAFARALLETVGSVIEPTPLPFAQWRTPAPRPIYSALTSWRLEWAGVEPMPRWQDAMQRFVQEYLHTQSHP
ncbi:MAG: NAD(P)-dependent oxidoreductase [Fimbriimonadales bacterium]|nr:MAG: NAD(P)-dependent oxidoreductase [Fimbriimonadales bacterium]